MTRVKFRDIFAILLTMVTATMWGLTGAGIVDIPGEMLGALIATWTMVVQFYFRKKPDEPTK